MKKIIVRCPHQFKDQIVSYYALFKYELESEQEILFSRSKLIFVTEKEDEKLENLMFKYKLKPFLTFVPLLVGCLLLLVLTTLFLVFTLIGNGDRMANFICCMVPVFCLLPLIALYTYLRYSFDSKNILILSNLRDIEKEMEK